MNLPRIRKVLLWSFIGFLSLTALIAVFSVLSGTFGETQMKVIGTTLTISVTSICAMCCAAFIEKRGVNPFCYVGIISAVIAAILLIIGIWSEINSDVYWKTTITLIVVTIAFAQTLLLLIPSLAANHRWTQTLLIVFISILALQIIFAVWAKIDDEGYYRGMAVVAIFVVLMTLIIPICSKLSGRETESLDRLILRKISDEIYADQLGRKLHVTEIETGNKPEV